MHMISVIDTIYEDDLVASIEERLRVDVVATVIINFEDNGIDSYEEARS